MGRSPLDQFGPALYDALSTGKAGGGAGLGVGPVFFVWCRMLEPKLSSTKKLCQFFRFTEFGGLGTLWAVVFGC